MSPRNPLPLLAPALAVGLLAAPAATAATFLIDFGMAASMNPSTQGAPTTSPDLNGNHWNNVTSTAYATTIAGGTGNSLSNLVSTTNEASGLGLTLSTGWRSSGIANGGLNQNTPALGSIGIQTATQDYYFVESNFNTSATITFTGLDPALTYNFGLFGSRETTSSRITNYSITDINGVHSANLQTSGTDIGTGGYDGNNNTVIQFDGLVPDVNGELALTVSVVQGGFAYLGAVEITSVPEPSAALLGGLGAIGLCLRRRTSR